MYVIPHLLEGFRLSSGLQVELPLSSGIPQTPEETTYVSGKTSCFCDIFCALVFVLYIVYKPLHIMFCKNVVETYIHMYI